MDGVPLVETLLSEPDTAQPSTSLENIEVDQPRSKRRRTSGKPGKSGAGSKTKLVNAVSDEAENGGKNSKHPQQSSTEKSDSTY
ncbi:Hypothetical predicted protein [Paramuricea clavata]|uniref:Uncharacterized protein n=1 Tax=Paramuricea clavata TaxID=317549 RepID=A0A7D9DZQ3_PARCT|nr:Hypothetical predicted protein [Paramuricea clavata]